GEGGETSDGGLILTASNLEARSQDYEFWIVGRCRERTFNHRARFTHAFQVKQGLSESNVRGDDVWRRFDQASELHERFFVESTVVQEVRQIGARGRKPWIDAQRLVVVGRGQVWATLAFCQDAECVVGLGDVRVQAACSGQQLPGAFEVSALQLDQPLVGQRIHEFGAVLERQAEARVCRLQVAGGQGGHACLVQGQRF